MVTVYAKIGTPVVSDKVKHVDIWHKATEGIGRITVLLDNTNGQFNDIFSADDIIDVNVNGAHYFDGYADIGRPISLGNVYEQMLRITGRNYGQDLANKIINKFYPRQHADDIIDDMLSTAGCEITFTSPHTAPEIQYLGGKNEYLVEAFRSIWEEINYDGYVDRTKALKMFAIGSLDSGVTLKCVAEAVDNNILNLEKIEFDALELWNYILVQGKKVEDGWTEGNAADWAGETGNVVSNDTEHAVAGASAIKCEKGEGATSSLILTFPRYHYESLDWRTTGNAGMDFCLLIYEDGEGKVTWSPNVRLEDDAGNQILYTFSDRPYDNIMDKFTVPIGMDCEIHSKTIWEAWRYSVGTTFTWNVKKVTIEVGNVATYFILDGLSLPARMVAVAEHVGSQSTYKLRQLPLTNFSIESQIELDELAKSIRDKRNAPLEGLKVTVVGTAGIVDNTRKFLPGYKVTVNSPGDNLDNVAYRITETHDIIGENVFPGYDFITELTLLPATLKMDSQRLGYSETSETAFLRRLHERIKFLEKYKELTNVAMPTLPKGISAYLIRESEGEAFPENPYDMMRFYRTDLDKWFRYSAALGAWKPLDFTSEDHAEISHQGYGIILYDLETNRPAAGVVGRIFNATDTHKTYYDNGSAWVFYGTIDLDKMNNALNNPNQIETIIKNIHLLEDISESKVGLQAGYHLIDWDDGGNIKGNLLKQFSVDYQRLAESVGTKAIGVPLVDYDTEKEISYSGVGWGGWVDVSKIFKFSAFADIKHQLTKIICQAKVAGTSAQGQVKVLYSINSGSSWSQFGATQNVSQTSYGAETFTGSVTTTLNQPFWIKLEGRVYAEGTLCRLFVKWSELQEKASLGKRADIS